MANIDKIKDLGTVTKISKNAFAVIARCPNSGQMYGITVDDDVLILKSYKEQLFKETKKFLFL